MKTLIDKADILIEALPYLLRFQGAICVIKYGGSFMDSPEAAGREAVARDIVFLAAAGLRPVVVHGGGKAITRAMEKAGRKATFVQGMRVTDDATAHVVEQVLSREINPQIVETIQAVGGKAKGFSGAEIFTCRKLWLNGQQGEKLDAGYIGEVTEVKSGPLLDCLHHGIIPVISPTARDTQGMIYNCNADVSAAQATIALQARRLAFMSDVPGLLRDPADATTLIPRLRIGEVEGLKKAGIIDKGMIPKINSAVEAVEAGIEKVTLLDGRAPHCLLLEIFAEQAPGTEITL